VRTTRSKCYCNTIILS